jgi:tripartite-type tricarboxylate transporter receptor subunit TctC
MQTVRNVCLPPLAALLLAQIAMARSPSAYPSRPIRLLVPMAAGAGTDIGARILSTKLAEAIAQQVVVDNRAGASGIVGAELAARAAPDDHQS